MKTTNFKISITLSFILFITVSMTANPLNTGDNATSGVKDQMTGTEATTSETDLNTESEFSYLRFDVDTFTAENALTELPVISTDYLRFDVNDFAATGETEISELPVTAGLEYLRFDVTHYSSRNTSEITEMPETAFNSLCFDVNKYSTGNTPGIDELPVN